MFVFVFWLVLICAGVHAGMLTSTLWKKEAYQVIESLTQSIFLGINLEGLNFVAGEAQW